MILDDLRNIKDRAGLRLTEIDEIIKRISAEKSEIEQLLNSKAPVVAVTSRVQKGTSEKRKATVLALFKDRSKVTTLDVHAALRDGLSPLSAKTIVGIVLRSMVDQGLLVRESWGVYCLNGDKTVKRTKRPGKVITPKTKALLTHMRTVPGQTWNADQVIQWFHHNGFPSTRTRDDQMHIAAQLLADHTHTGALVRVSRGTYKINKFDRVK